MSIATTSIADGIHAQVRMADFILANIEPILAQWEEFARSVWPAPASKDPAELRDHAEAILRATAADMKSDQSAKQQSAKAEGRGDGGASGRRLDTASDQHGIGRVDSGFKLTEVLAEYRALRASVIRLWRVSQPAPRPVDLDDLTRFNESIDQSLARAVASFTDGVDRARQLFLAILGHDLRTPLAAIRITAEVLARRTGSDTDTIDRTSRITAAAKAMNRMIDDLLDFTAAGLGGGMPLSRGKTDLCAICSEVVEEVRAAHPDRSLAYTNHGDANGEWDTARLRQMVSNLLGNAIQHGDADQAVDISVNGSSADVLLTVHNSGPPIPPNALPLLFDPLRRTAEAPDAAPAHRRSGSIGLGLYIAHQIVIAHGGAIAATSTADDGTTFTVRLPRRVPRR